MGAGHGFPVQSWLTVNHHLGAECLCAPSNTIGTEEIPGNKMSLEPQGAYGLPGRFDSDIQLI